MHKKRCQLLNEEIRFPSHTKQAAVVYDGREVTKCLAIAIELEGMGCVKMGKSNTQKGNSGSRAYSLAHLVVLPKTEVFQ